MGKDFSDILLNESRDTGTTSGVTGPVNSLSGSNGAVHGPEGSSEEGDSWMDGWMDR